MGIKNNLLNHPLIIDGAMGAEIQKEKIDSSAWEYNGKNAEGKFNCK